MQVGDRCDAVIRVVLSECSAHVRLDVAVDRGGSQQRSVAADRTTVSQQIGGYPVALTDPTGCVDHDDDVGQRVEQPGCPVSRAGGR